MRIQYHLQKYNGQATRHECPQCHDKKSFTYYVDDAGNYVDKTVGRCNHEAECGYHYTPSEYFKDHPEGKPAVQRVFKPVEKPRKRLCTIDMDWVLRSMSYSSNFVNFLCGLFTTDEIEALMRIFRLGATKNGSVIYWQIDSKGRCRTGKVIQYDPETGHRIKTGGGITWIHSLLKSKGVLDDDWELSQCLFGAHQLMNKGNQSRKIALVESEKTAIIGTAYNPEFVWMACGGISQLSAERCLDIRGKDVILFPDTDTEGIAYRLWCERAGELKRIGCKVSISDVLERTASDEDKEAKIDIGDVMVRELMMSPGEKAIKRLEERNPAFGRLVDKFDLEYDERT